jgi:hypothetical protein
MSSGLQGFFSFLIMKHDLQETICVREEGEGWHVTSQASKHFAEKSVCGRLSRN